MKNVIFILLILISTFVWSQQTEEASVDTIYVPIVYIGDTTFVGSTPITEIDMSCPHCIIKYINNLKWVIEPVKITVYKEEVIISKESKIIKDIYMIYYKDTNHGIYFTKHYLLGEKYRLQMIFNHEDGFYYLNVLDDRDIATTYKLQKQ